MKSERNQLVEPALTSLIQEVLAKIRALETEARRVSKSIPNTATHREKDKLMEVIREKSTEKIELAKSLNLEVRRQIRNLNVKISEKLKAGKDLPKVRKTIVKKSKFVRKRTSDRPLNRDHNFTPKVYVCFCGKQFEDELVVCSKELCKIKYFHKQCVGSLVKEGQMQWVCKECLC